MDLKLIVKLTLNALKLVFLLGLFVQPINAHPQSDDFKAPRKNQAKKSRMQRKAIGYEQNIKKLKKRGRELLGEEIVNYTKVEKIKTKIEKLSAKVQKCRYKEKSKRHLKVQERSAKKRMKKGLKSHRKLKSNRRKFP